MCPTLARIMANTHYQTWAIHRSPKLPTLGLNLVLFCFLICIKVYQASMLS